MFIVHTHLLLDYLIHRLTYECFANSNDFIIDSFAAFTLIAEGRFLI